jgi:hypothetical protein
LESHLKRAFSPTSRIAIRRLACAARLAAGVAVRPSRAVSLTPSAVDLFAIAIAPVFRCCAMAFPAMRTDAAEHPFVRREGRKGQPFRAFGAAFMRWLGDHLAWDWIFRSLFSRERFSREVLARGVTTSAVRWLTAPLPLNGTAGRGLQGLRGRTCRRLPKAGRRDEPAVDRSSHTAGTVRHRAFLLPLSLVATSLSYGRGARRCGVGRRPVRRDRTGYGRP